MLVLDANVALAASASRGGFGPFGDEPLVAPPLLWPEARSALHVARWRGVISEEVADRSLSVLESGRLRERRHKQLAREVWRIADQLDWAKTYDAEYLALASLLDAPLLTFDLRLRRAAEVMGLAADASWLRSP